MQTPPPFHGYEQHQQPAKAKKNPFLILFAVLGVLFICCGLPLGGMFFYGNKFFKGAMTMGACMANAGRLGSSLDKYVAKYKHYPKASDWQNELKPFMTDKVKDKDMPLKLWTRDGVWSCNDGGTESGFAFNTEYSGKKPEDIKSVKDAVIIYQCPTVGFNQNGVYKPLPHDTSPKVLGGMIDEKLGWMVLTGDGKIGFVDKTGKIKQEKGRTMKFDMDMDEFEEPATDKPAANEPSVNTPPDKA